MANIRSMNDLKRMNYQRERRENIANSEKAFWSIAGGAMAAIASLSPSFAAKETETLETRIIEMLGDVYGVIIGVATAVATCLVAVCLILRMVSKNQRTVDEATQWMKRIIICWVCLTLLSVLVGWFSSKFTFSDWGDVIGSK